MDNLLTEKFDDMLWSLMQTAADNTHSSLEPWWSCLDPSLPGFQPLDEKEEDGDATYNMKDGTYVKTPSKSEVRNKRMKESGGALSKLLDYFTSSIDDQKAKGKINSLYCLTHLHSTLIMHVSHNPSLTRVAS